MPKKLSWPRLEILVILATFQGLTFVCMDLIRHSIKGANADADAKISNTNNQNANNVNNAGNRLSWGIIGFVVLALGPVAFMVYLVWVLITKARNKAKVRLITRPLHNA